MPDIDVDFCIRGRDQVIQYVKDKYGADKVAQITTFGTLKAKAAIRDVGRALGLSFAETDAIAKLVPASRQGFDCPLSEALKQEPRLNQLADDDPRVANLINHALRLEGLTRHSSTHAAGVVISNRPLMDHLPLYVDRDGGIVTQYDMSSVEKIGLVKFDFLGLKTLTLIHDCLDLIRQSRGTAPDLQGMPLDDEETYRLVGSGNTTGIFQLESTGIREMSVRIKPNCFEDLVAILALYRPGPLDSGMAEEYIKRKSGKEQTSYLHPALRPILKDTYGVIVYQEQVMEIAQNMANYSLGDADILRRAMGKKDPEEMASQRQRFTEGGPGQRHPGGPRHRHLRPDGNLRAVRLQQVPFRRLRPDLLPYGLSEDALPGGIHGGPDELGNGRHRQGDQEPRRVPRAGRGGDAAGRERGRRRIHGGGGTDPLRPFSGQERRRKGG